MPCQRSPPTRVRLSFQTPGRPETQIGLRASLGRLLNNDADADLDDGICVREKAPVAVRA